MRFTASLVTHAYPETRTIRRRFHVLVVWDALRRPSFACGRSLARSQPRTRCPRAEGRRPGRQPPPLPQARPPPAEGSRGIGTSPADALNTLSTSDPTTPQAMIREMSPAPSAQATRTHGTAAARRAPPSPPSPPTGGEKPSGLTPPDSLHRLARQDVDRVVLAVHAEFPRPGVGRAGRERAGRHHQQPRDRPVAARWRGRRPSTQVGKHLPQLARLALALGFQGRQPPRLLSPCCCGASATGDEPRGDVRAAEVTRAKATEATRRTRRRASPTHHGAQRSSGTVSSREAERRGQRDGAGQAAGPPAAGVHQEARRQEQHGVERPSRPAGTLRLYQARRARRPPGPWPPRPARSAASAAAAHATPTAPAISMLTAPATSAAPMAPATPSPAPAPRRCAARGERKHRLRTQTAKLAPSIDGAAHASDFRPPGTRQRPAARGACPATAAKAVAERHAEHAERAHERQADPEREQGKQRERRGVVHGARRVLGPGRAP